MTVVSSPTPAPTPAGAAGLLPERATAFLVGIVDDAEAVTPGSTSLADAIQTHRSPWLADGGDGLVRFRTVGPTVLAPLAALGGRAALTVGAC